jgi:hypothetical protein
MSPCGGGVAGGPVRSRRGCTARASPISPSALTAHSRTQRRSLSIAIKGSTAAAPNCTTFFHSAPAIAQTWSLPSASSDPRLAIPALALLERGSAQAKDALWNEVERPMSPRPLTKGAVLPPNRATLAYCPLWVVGEAKAQSRSTDFVGVGQACHPIYSGCRGRHCAGRWFSQFFGRKIVLVHLCSLARPYTRNPAKKSISQQLPLGTQVVRRLDSYEK